MRVKLTKEALGIFDKLIEAKNNLKRVNVKLKKYEDVIEGIQEMIIPLKEEIKKYETEIAHYEALMR